MSLETFREFAYRNGFATESMASALRRDKEKEAQKEDNKKDNFIDLSKLYKLYMQPDVLTKYEDRYRQLSHVDKEANKLRGYIYFTNAAVGDKGDLVAFFSVKLQSGKTWIDTLEVDPKYRGNKLSYQLLDIACKEFGATDVKIRKDNERALHVFTKYGFTKYDTKENYVYLTNEDITTDNPVLKKDDSAKEAYVDTYIKAVKKASGVDYADAFAALTADDLASESIFGKKSKEELIESAIKKAKQKCDTPEKKAIFKEVITNNERVYKQTLKQIYKLDKQYAKGNISLKDYTKQRKSAITLIRKTMTEFNININNFIDNKDKPTPEEMAQFTDIINKIKKAI